MKARFTADQFTPTEWSSAADKAKFANHFVRFVESDFKETLFPKWFYRQLSNTFGHIAHYDIYGFYATFFKTTRGKVDFLIQTEEWPCYGSPTYTYSDVEQVLRAWVKEKRLVQYWQGRLAAEIEIAERFELARLSAKYQNPDGTVKPLGTVEK
jgi:hypothetical protein